MDTPLIARLRGFGTTIFAEMTALAQAHDAINLGQGFPQFDGPPEVLEAARDAISAGHNQYPPGTGIPPLRRAVAEHQRRWYGLDLDPDTQVLVSAGATEAMTAAILAMCEVGDEVVALEPTYDCYRGAVAMAGGVVVPVRLHEPAEAGAAYTLDLEELARAITPRTRLLIVNSPHNPTGHVLSEAELAGIAELAVERDLIVLTDEVYEHLVYDDRRHVPLATLPGMFERTVTISSAGKTFSVTGWKIGWLTGPEEFLRAIFTTKQNMTFASGAPLQHGVAAGLALDRAWFDAQRDRYAELRGLLDRGLREAGLRVHHSPGTFFLTADIGDLDYADGVDFCRRLPQEIGVAAIPSQLFYADQASASRFVRFCYAKDPAVLAEAARRLTTLGDR